MKLGDHFSMMMLADVPEHEINAVKEAFSKVDGIRTSTFDTTDPSAVPVNASIKCKSRYIFFAFCKK